MTPAVVLVFLFGVSVGVLVAASLLRRLADNNAQSAYDTGYHDGRHDRPRKKVL